MRVLGLDPGASLGFALLEGGAYLDGGAEVFAYPTEAQQRKGMAKGKKWSEIAAFISTTISEYRPDYIFIEQVMRHSSVLAAHSYGFIALTAEAKAYDLSIPYLTIPVGTWKKLTTGAGNADKEIVMTAMQQRFAGVEFVTHDHSDACGIAAAGHTFLSEGRLSELSTSKGKRKTK